MIYRKGFCIAVRGLAVRRRNPARAQMAVAVKVGTIAGSTNIEDGGSIVERTLTSAAAAAAVISAARTAVKSGAVNAVAAAQ
jgi:hypothetical protein